MRARNSPLGQGVLTECVRLLQDHFRDLHFGLKLISGNTGQTEFELEKSFAENPDTALSQRVVASYNEKNPDSSRLGFQNGF